MTTDSSFELDDRAARVGRTLARAVEASASSQYLKTVAFLLSAQTEAGFWGVDRPIWHAIITSQAIEALIRLGIPVDAEWSISTQDGRRRAGSIRRACEWLLSNQRIDGSWGEDAWTVCEIVRVLRLAGCPSDDDHIVRAVTHLRAVVSANWAAEASNPWFGAAFPATVAETLHSLVEGLLGQMWEGFDSETGRFQGHATESTHDIPAEWQTANVLIALNRLGFNLDDSRLSKSVQWLQTSQRRDGSWCDAVEWVRFIYTHDAVMALLPVLGPDHEVIENGISWFLARQEGSGCIVDVGASARAALLFARIHGDQLVSSVPYPVVLEAVEVITQLREAAASAQSACAGATASIDLLQRSNEELRAAGERHLRDRDDARADLARRSEELRRAEEERARLQQQIRSYWFRLTDRQVAVLAMLLGLAGVLVAVVPALVSFLSSIPAMPSNVQPSNVPPGPLPTPSVTGR